MTKNDEARQHFRAGLALYRTFLPENNAEARREFEAAIHFDERFAPAHALLSAAHRQDWIMGWARDYEPSMALAFHHAEMAVWAASHDQLPQALLIRGFASLYAGRLEEATADAEKSIKLNPGFADGYALAAHILCYQVRPLEALAKMNPDVTRDPKYPFNYGYYTGHAYYLLGYLVKEPDQLDRKTALFEEAERHLRSALSEKDKGPNFRPASSYLVATLMELGRERNAVEQTARVPRPAYLRDPQQLAAYITRTLPYTDPAVRNHLIALWQAADRGVAQHAAISV